MYYFYILMTDLIDRFSDKSSNSSCILYPYKRIILKKACKYQYTRIHYCRFSMMPVILMCVVHYYRAVVITKVAYFGSLYFEKVSAGIFFHYFFVFCRKYSFQVELQYVYIYVYTL